MSGYIYDVSNHDPQCPAYEYRMVCCCAIIAAVRAEYVEQEVQRYSHEP